MRRSSVLVFVVALVAFLVVPFPGTGSPALADVDGTSSPNAAIPDNGYIGVGDGNDGFGVDAGMVCATIDFPALPGAPFVTSVGIDLSLTHTWIGDLTVKLQSPDGKVLALMERVQGTFTNPLGDNGSASAAGDSSNLDGLPLHFADGNPVDPESMGNTIDGTQFVGTDDGFFDYFPNPDQALVAGSSIADFAAFKGGPVSGPWTLCVGDSISADTGIFHSWTVHLVEAVPTVLFVDVDASGGANNGLSWADAFIDLQSALTAAMAGQEIWVAAGTYKPGAQDESFLLKDGVGVYGGFAGTETQRSERDFVANLTRLSGDVNGDDNAVVDPAEPTRAENNFHVVRSSGLSESAVLDGFTVAGGNANGSFPDGSGGGMYNDASSPTVANVTFILNTAQFGGGMGNVFSSSPLVANSTFTLNTALGGGAIYNSESSPTVRDVAFTDNTAGSGGGMYNQSSSPTVTGVAFTDNTATNGGGMYNQSSSSPTVTGVTFTTNAAEDGGGMANHEFSSPEVTNVTFIYNRATDVGGGMHNASSSSPEVTNVTFNGNSAADGGGIFNSGSSEPVVENSILWGNTLQDLITPSNVVNFDGVPTFRNSLLEGSGGSAAWVGPGDDLGGNLDSHPLFFGPEGRVREWSPAVNAGLDSLVPAGVTTDLDGGVRFAGTVDMGAFEIQPRFVNENVVGGLGDGSSWPNAFTDLQPALTTAVAGQEIWVAAGTYKPGVQADSFVLVDRVEVYGGFTGSETLRSERDFVANLTVLSGDVNGDDNAVVDPAEPTRAENNFHVVRSSGLSEFAVLDGFTVAGGNANGAAASLDNSGGGMLNLPSASPTVSNVVFAGNAAAQFGGGMYNFLSSPTVTDVAFAGNTAGNSGGGMANNGSSATPVVTNVTFTDNTAGSGGGMANLTASPIVTNVTFANNTAPVGSGGGMFNQTASSSSPMVTNVAFTENSARWGGGMYNSLSSPVVTNVTFTANSAEVDGGGMYNEPSSSPEVGNSILWGNTLLDLTTPSNVVNFDPSALPTFQNSLLEGSGGSAAWVGPGDDQGGNLDADPLFSDPEGRLGPFSPAIDTGLDSLVPAGVVTDLDGSARFVGTVDMGAFESLSSGLVFVPVEPTVCFDTRSGGGALVGSSGRDFQVTGAGDHSGQGGLAGGCGVPDQAVSVLLNLVAINPAGGGNLKVDATDAASVNGGVVNYQALSPNLNNSNAVPVELSSNPGSVNVFANGAGVDVRGVALGYFVDPSLESSGLVFVPTEPTVCFDSRTTQGGTGAFTTGEDRDFQITGTGDHTGQGGLDAGCAIPAGAEAVMLNLVAIDPAGGGNLRIDDSDASAVNGGVVNFQALSANLNNSNAIPVGVSPTGGVNVFANGSGVDVRGVALGYFAAQGTPGGLLFHQGEPTVCFDTRTTQGGAGAFTTGEDRDFQLTGTGDHSGQGGLAGGCGVATDAEAVFLNLVAIQAQGGGNLRIDDTDASAVNGGVVNYQAVSPNLNNSNALPVGVSPTGGVNVFANGNGVDTRGIALGYFTPEPVPG